MAQKTLNFTPQIITKRSFDVVGESILCHSFPFSVFKDDYGYPFEFDITKGADYFENIEDSQNGADSISLLFSSPNGVVSTKMLSIITREGKIIFVIHCIFQETFPKLDIGLSKIKIEYDNSVQDEEFITSPVYFLVESGL